MGFGVDGVSDPTPAEEAPFEVSLARSPGSQRRWLMTHLELCCFPHISRQHARESVRRKKMRVRERIVQNMQWQGTRKESVTSDRFSHSLQLLLNSQAKDKTTRHPFPESRHSRLLSKKLFVATFQEADSLTCRLFPILVRKKKTTISTWVCIIKYIALLSEWVSEKVSNN